MKVSSAKVDVHLDCCTLDRSYVLCHATLALLFSSREQLQQCFVDQLSQQWRLGWFKVSGFGIGHKNCRKIVAWYEIQSLPRSSHHLHAHAVGKHGLQHP